ncbi:Bet v1-like protein [Piromyces finnis]|uniref:Bet v1-like protein n=1 Tax=Piromyces finnis TaxID=1754191 RepID=A0A1Y1VDD1_9FUNG|nr:Bet v1-like protein [Piromyces finnis]|eukprot:ORX53331.1 Bet v1-like protein [Piromyces finnis]
MRIFCCFPFKKRRTKDKKNSLLKQGFIDTTKKPIKSSIKNSDIFTSEGEIIQLKGVCNSNNNIENVVSKEGGNTSIDTSVIAVTALSYAPSTAEDHSYYVIDYTNVSSLERDHLQDKYDSLQLYSPTPSIVPSLHSNRKSLTEFKSAISLESTESFFTTVSNKDDTENFNSCSHPLSKKTSAIVNTNYTNNNNSICVFNDDRSINNNKDINNNKYLSATNANINFKSKKSLSFHSLKSQTKYNKDNTITDTNETINNIIKKTCNDSEEWVHSTDITVNNLMVLSKTNNTKETNTTFISSIPKDINNNSVKDKNLSISSNPSSLLSNQISNDTKPFSSKVLAESKSKSKSSIYVKKDLDQIAERALHPDLTHYTLDSVIKNRIKVYTRVRPLTGINEYIILGHLNNVTLKEAYDVYMDLEYRKEWDDLKQQINIFERKDKTFSSQSNINNDLKDFEIHWEIKFPWPFCNREYIFERNTYEHKFNDMLFLIADNSSLNNTNSNEELNNKNINSRTIRITEYEQMTVFYSDCEDGKCNVYMEYYDDPKGNIPLVLKNWVVSRAAPNFIMNIEKACKEYKAFEKRLKSNKHIKELNEILGKSLQQAFDDFEL